jgi:hypothetical protein
VADEVAERGTRAVGVLVGVDKSTVARWGSDLRAWPADALLALADAAPAVATALRGCEPAAAGRADRALADAHATLCVLGEEVAALAADVADGAVTPAEARDGRTKIRTLLAHLRRLDADYAALAAQGER